MKAQSKRITGKQVGTGVMALAAIALLATSIVGGGAYADKSGLPDPGSEIVQGRTALLVTDPQNDFLSEEGVTWGLVGNSVTENNTVGNIERIFKAAKDNGFDVFISPHYYYPTDHGWKLSLIHI